MVEGCTPGNTPGELVVGRFNANFNGAQARCGNEIDGGIRAAAGASDGNGRPLTGSAGWQIEAPPNTTIQEVTFERSFQFAGPSNGLSWRVIEDDGTVLERVNAGTTPPPNGAVTLAVDSRFVRGVLGCFVQTGCNGGLGSLTVVSSKNFFVRMADRMPPTIVAEPPSPTTPLHGTVEIPYQAEDVGSGVAVVFLDLDFVPGQSGQIIGESRDDNGGKCQEPFRDLVPCRLQVNKSISFDTTKVPNGRHTISLVVADSASNVVFDAALPVIVDNPPAREGGGPGSQPPPRTGGALRPETTISRHPPKRTSSRRARFSFKSDLFSAHFACKLDRRPFKSCRSPFKAKVRPGRHSFQVRAVDGAGNADLSPAVFRWRVL